MSMPGRFSDNSYFGTKEGGIKREQLDKLVEDKVAKLPGNAKEALASRREIAVPVRGDAIVFLLQKGSTDDVVVEEIAAAKARIAEVINQGEPDVDYIEISYPHLTFSNTVPPSSIPKYLNRKLQQTPENIERMGGVLQQFVDGGITCRAKECKMNLDGHIIARFEINEKEELLNCKSRIAKLVPDSAGSGSLYERYKDDPEALEKQTTLASVLFVVDIDALSGAQQDQIKAELQALNKRLQEVGDIKLNSVVWKEYGVRNLSEDTTLRTRKFDKGTMPYFDKATLSDIEMSESAFGQGSNFARKVRERSGGLNTR